MATWAGWQNDLLAAASLPTSDDNRTFLSDWGSMETTSCTNNPVVISHSTRSSSDCKRLTSTRTAQNYLDQQQGAGAFSVQLHSGNFPHLLAALKSGTPYTAPSPHDVIGDLIAWGALAYADTLLNNYGPLNPPSGGGSGGPKAPRVHSGWRDLRRTVNVTGPAALKSSERLTRAALRSLGRARKVRL